MKISLLLICLVLPSIVVSYSSGPPIAVCESMSPDKDQHSALPAESQVPYQLILSKNSIESGESIDLTLSKIDELTPDFKGFIIEAIDPQDNSIYGQFELAGSNTKIVACGPEKVGAIAHNSPSPKSSITVKWISPIFNSGSAKKIDFFFTVVQERTTYWVKQAAKTPLTISPSTGSAPTAVQKPSSDQKLAPVLHQDYEGCANTKGCFGIEDKCIETGTCQVMVSYKHLQDKKAFQFVLHGNGIASGDYIAVGLSTDSKMSDDLVFSCTNGGAEMKVTWNQGRNNLDSVTGIVVKSSNVQTVNGVTTCAFEVDEALNPVPPRGSAEPFDLLNTKYHLLLATGPVKSTGELEFHSTKTPSEQPIDLKASSLVGGKAKSWLIQVHGCLMVFAWLASAASGMMMARYYKKTFTSVKPMGKDLWFRFHQMCMTLAVVLSLIAFFVILAEVRVEPFDAENLKINPHAAVGIVSIILAVIQPVMAFFRPHPGTKFRWIFNWAHWFVGNSAFILGIAAIFLAVELPSPNLPETLTHAMIAYVVIHSLAHFVLVLQRYLLRDDLKTVDSGDEPGGVIRKIVGAVYFLFVWTFTIAFVVIIVQSKK